jgi:hypothetical protein
MGLHRIGRSVAVFPFGNLEQVEAKKNTAQLPS